MKAFGRSTGLFIANVTNCHTIVCVHVFLIEDNNFIGNNNNNILLSVSEILNLTGLAAYPRRLLFLLFAMECILGHWREKSGQRGE